MKKKILLGIYIFVSIMIIGTNESFGYLDPSAMTYIIQIISAIVIGLSTAIGIIIYKIKKTIFKNKNKNKIVKMQKIEEFENDEKNNNA